MLDIDYVMKKIHDMGENAENVLAFIVVRYYLAHGIPIPYEWIKEKSKNETDVFPAGKSDHQI